MHMELEKTQINALMKQDTGKSLSNCIENTGHVLDNAFKAQEMSWTQAYIKLSGSKSTHYHSI